MLHYQHELKHKFLNQTTCMFICEMVFKSHTHRSNAQSLSVPSITILPTTASIFHYLNCFNHVIYIQASHLNIVSSARLCQILKGSLTASLLMEWSDSFKLTCLHTWVKFEYVLCKTFFVNSVSFVPRIWEPRG